MKNKPLKRFGQNYLVDKNIIIKIVKRFDPKTNDSIIEIGPGRGALTELLSEACSNVRAVEIDTRVIEELKNNIPNVEFINADFLKSDSNIIFPVGTKHRVIGNIPYNITSPIIFNLLENRERIEDAMLMVQLEMAKRMIAKKGTKDYGILSVLLESFCEVELCFKISPNVFFPKPNVDSAIIHIKFNKSIDPGIEFENYKNIIKAAFGNRRKTLKNSFKNSIFIDCDFSGIEKYLSKRAEELDINDFQLITKILCRGEYG